MSQSPIKLLLVDDDPIFRLGLSQVLASVETLSVIGQSDTNTILERSVEPPPDVILLDPLPRRTREEAWQLCQWFLNRYRQAKLVLFTSRLEPEEQLLAQSLGIVGYIPKGIAIEEAIAIIGQIATGQAYWPSLSPILSSQPLTRLQTHWLIRLGQSGLSQIEDSLAIVQERLDRSNLSNLDWVYWGGRKRELLAAAWLVRKLLPVGVPRLNAYTQTSTPKVDPQPLPIPPTEALPILVSSRPLCTSIVFDDTLAKMQLGLENITNIPMEIDVLQTSRKRELLYMILDRLRKTVDDLRFLKISEQELNRRTSLIVQEIWKETSYKFIELYIAPLIGSNSEQIYIFFLEEIDFIKKEILDKLPFVNELLTYLVFEKTLLVDGVGYRANSPEAVARAEILLQNLMTQVANAIMSVILNQFTYSEEIKKNLYKQSFISSREMAKLRNDLSWKYRKEKYWEEPEFIFESKFRLFFYENNKIKQTFINFPRQMELNQLSGIQWVVSMGLEAGDAISPRMKAIVSFLGKGVVYVLIQVIGKGIGLIIRGIIQGIGTAWQDVRYGKNRD